MWSAQKILALTNSLNEINDRTLTYRQREAEEDRHPLRKGACQHRSGLGLGYEHTRWPTAATWIRISIQAYSRAQYGHGLSINGF